jgi:uncharacterized membrane protein YphA (DoxX/SURF4 family)
MNFGTRVYGLGAAAMGVTAVAFHAMAPAHPPASDVLAYAEAAILILASLALYLPRASAAGGVVLAVYFTLMALVSAGPPLLAKPLDVGSWEGLAELVALATGGVVAFALAPDDKADRAAQIARAGRLAFGLCLLVFGAAHFAFAKYTASLVPAWLPPGQMAWTYLTGIAQIAAGLALLSGVQARLAAILLTTMYGLFAVLVHLPLILASPHVRFNWNELFETLTLMGVAWTMADAIGRKGNARPGS